MQVLQRVFNRNRAVSLTSSIAALSSLLLLSSSSPSWQQEHEEAQYTYSYTIHGHPLTQAVRGNVLYQTKEGPKGLSHSYTHLTKERRTTFFEGREGQKNVSFFSNSNPPSLVANYRTIAQYKDPITLEEFQRMTEFFFETGEVPQVMQDENLPVFQLVF